MSLDPRYDSSKGYLPAVARTPDDLLFAMGQEPSGALAEAAQLFRGLRSVLKLTLEGVADRLSTGPHIIEALESGRIDALPHWPETQRLVCAYTDLAGCDPAPVLAVLKAEIERRNEVLRAALVEVQHKTVPPSPAAVVAQLDKPVNVEAQGQEPPSGPRWRKGRGGRPVPVGRQVEGSATQAPHRKVRASLAGLSRPIEFGASAVKASRGIRVGLIGSGLVLILVMALCQPGLINLVSTRLPDPMARGLRSVHDYLLLRLAPEREGLRWIEVDDPRARRTDKLHNVRQTD
jgi:hypothetical protein